MPLMTGSARLSFDCDTHDKEKVLRLLSERYAGRTLSYSRLSGSVSGDGYWWTTVSGVFEVPESVLHPGCRAQLLTQYVHYKAIEAMFLAGPGEIMECSERFEWIHPIAIESFVQAHPLD